MKRKNVRLREDVGERKKILRVEVGRIALTGRVGDKDFETERTRLGDDFFADVARADEAEGFAAKTEAAAARDEKERGGDVLRDAFGVATRRGGPRDAALRKERDVYVVGADDGGTVELEVVGVLEKRGVYFCGGAREKEVNAAQVVGRDEASIEDGRFAQR